jgi:PIN domain nuclease of toxin-antitoxin system
LNPLLDTHSLIWYALGDPRLSATAQAIVEDIPIISVDSVFDAYPVRRIW